MIIKCWNLVLNAWGLKRFMVVVDITKKIDWLNAIRPKKKKIQWNSNLAKFDANLSFNAYWKL